MKNLILVLLVMSAPSLTFAGGLQGKCVRDGKTVSVVFTHEEESRPLTTVEYASEREAVSASGNCSAKAELLKCSLKDENLADSGYSLLNSGKAISTQETLLECEIAFAREAINGLQPGDKDYILMQLAKPGKL